MPRLEAFSLTCILSRVTSSGFSPMVRRTVQHIDSAFAPIIDDFKEINGQQSTLNSQRQHSQPEMEAFKFSTMAI